MKVSIVMPVYNEEEVVSETISDIEEKLNINYEILIVNDHSTDSTVQIANNMIGKYPNIRIIDNNQGKGFTGALKTGFRNVAGEAVVPFMADSCDDPLTIPNMLEKIEEGYDVVCGSRYMKGGKRVGGRLSQGLFSRFVGLTMRLFTGIPTHDCSNAFKMYRKEVLDNIEIEEAGFAVSMEMIIRAFSERVKITEVPTTWYGREKGESKFKILSVGKNYLKWYVRALFFRRRV